MFTMLVCAGMIYRTTTHLMMAAFAGQRQWSGLFTFPWLSVLMHQLPCQWHFVAGLLSNYVAGEHSDIMYPCLQV